MAGLVAKFDAGDIYTVEILLNCSEDDLAGLGIQRPFARTILKKIHELSGASSI